MDRILEPELMDGNIQAFEYSSFDFSQSDKAFLKKLKKILKNYRKSIDCETFIIDMGCGPGKITELIGRSWPDAKVIGIDGSQAMLRIAEERRNFLLKSKICSNIKYLEANLSCHDNENLKTLPKGDIVISNSLLHHIHEPGNFWKAVKLLSNQECVVFHRDLRRPFSVEDAKDLKDKHLKEAPNVLIKDFIASLCASFTVQEIKDQLIKERLIGFNVSKVGDRYLDIYGSCSKKMSCL